MSELQLPQIRGADGEICTLAVSEIMPRQQLTVELRHHCYQLRRCTRVTYSSEQWGFRDIFVVKLLGTWQHPTQPGWLAFKDQDDDRGPRGWYYISIRQRAWGWVMPRYIDHGMMEQDLWAGVAQIADDLS